MPLDFSAYQPDDEILSTLIAADALLSGPEKWGRPGHVGRCVSNALVDVSGRFGPAHTYIMEMFNVRYMGDIFNWNDAPERTFADIKSLFARAIEKRRAEVLEAVSHE